jgi:hypothetical protein
LSSTAQESPVPGVSTSQQQPSQPSAVSAQAARLRDGAHDFDFLIGNWKAHVRRLPDRLVGSSSWVEYDGISNHKKILDSNANFEEFEVDNPEKHLHIKAQTLRLYNPESHQWSIYPLDLDKGALNLPPVVGQFTGRLKYVSPLFSKCWVDGSISLDAHAAHRETDFNRYGGKP